MAVGEAITNLAAARIDDIGQIKLSANWMAAAGHGGEDAALFDTVKAVGIEFCPALGVSIPVGKDSLSMRTKWEENGQDKAVIAPLSLIVTAFAPCADVRHTLTPQLRRDAEKGETELMLIDLGPGRTASAARRWRRSMASPATCRRMPMPACSRPSSARSSTSTATARSSPITTVPTAACSPPSAR